MKKTLFNNACKVIIALLGLAIALPLMAANSGAINYQARLLDAYGRRVNATVDLTFKIYDAATDGNLLWSETHSGVTVQDGVYAVVLGSTTPIPASVFAQNSVYLELGIDGSTMSPRQQMTAASYALVARTVMGSNIFENQSSDYVGIGTTNPAAKLDVNGTVKMTGFKLPTGGADNYVLASDADGNGTWQPMSVVLVEHDPIFTNWINIVYQPSTNAIWGAIGAEAATRAAADTALQGNIDTSSNALNTAIGTEATTRGNADTALQSNIGTSSNALNTAVGLRMLRAGDVMTGPLTNNVGFFGNAAGLTNISASGVSLTGVVQKIGDIMTGPLVISNNLTVALTNTAGDIVATNSITLRDAMITNWYNLTGSLAIAVGSLDTRVNTDLAGATNALYNATNALQTQATALQNATGTLNLATNALQVQATALQNATNSLNTRAIRWDNAVIATNGTGAIVFSNLYYYSAGAWAPANASTSTTAKGMLGLALGSGASPAATDGLLLNGYCTNAWGFGDGTIIYMSTSAGAMTTNRPTGTNNIVRIVGYAVTASRIYFDPDRTFIEILGD